MPNNDPQTIWQSQTTEEIKVSPAYFKIKAEQLRSRNLWIVVANDLVCLATAAFLGYVFMKTPNGAARAGLILLAAGLLYCMYQLHQRLWPASPAPADTGLDAYRRELMRWQASQFHAWRMLAPLLPGAIVFVASVIPSVIRAASENPSILKNGAPFCILLVVWLVAFIIVRKRRLRSIQQELDALGSF